MSPSAFDLYDFYIEPADLKGQTHRVKVVTAKSESIFDPILKRDVPRIVLAFENRKKKMPLNKTQAGAMIEIVGTDDYTKWVGAEILLTASMARNNKQTITITSAKIGPAPIAEKEG